MCAQVRVATPAGGTGGGIRGAGAGLAWLLVGAQRLAGAAPIGEAGLGNNLADDRLAARILLDPAAAQQWMHRLHTITENRDGLALAGKPELMRLPGLDQLHRVEI